MSGDYFSRPEMSQSRLKNFARSAGYYKYLEENPKESTDDMILGNVTHVSLMEREVFSKKVVIDSGFKVGKIDLSQIGSPDFMSRFLPIPSSVNSKTKMGKSQLYELKVSNPGKDIIPEKTFLRIKERNNFLIANSGKYIVSHGVVDKAHAMSASVLTHPKAAEILSLKIEVEKEFYFDLLGVACKAKIDAVVPEIHTIVDFKTSRFSSSKDFIREAINLHYDIQAYFYYEAYKSKYGRYPDFYAFIVVSKEEPYPVGVFEVDAEFLDRGRYYATKYLEQYKKCLETNTWPKNESDDVIKITTPDWAMREAMEFGESFFSTMTREQLR